MCRLPRFSYINGRSNGLPDDFCVPHITGNSTLSGRRFKVTDSVYARVINDCRLCVNSPHFPDRSHFQNRRLCPLFPGSCQIPDLSPAELVRGATVIHVIKIVFGISTSRVVTVFLLPLKARDCRYIGCRVLLLCSGSSQSHIFCK